MVNRIAVAAILLALAAPSRAAGNAMGDAKVIANGSGLGQYDGGCTGGSCGAQVAVPNCADETCRIQRASDEALRSNSLVTAEVRPRAAMVAEVPAPALGADKEGAKDKPGFFSKLWSGKGLLYGAAGAGIGAGVGWLVGGPIGAIIGGLLGAVGGFFLSKLLSR